MKIMAIGGGEIGRPGFPIETEAIDKEIIRMSGKRHPRLLFIPTASSDSEGYVKVVRKYFGTRLSCRVSVLYLLNRKLSKKEIKDKILDTDIVYVGGGNTLKMMVVWRKLGVDKALKQAIRKGVVLSGVSAGAVCWFRYANSDSRRFRNSKAPFIKIRGLGLILALGCPHYDIEKGRETSLKEMMRNTSGVAIALDNCAALEVRGGEYRICTSRVGAGAYRVWWSGERYYREHIPSTRRFRPITTLVRK